MGAISTLNMLDKFTLAVALEDDVRIPRSEVRKVVDFLFFNDIIDRQSILRYLDKNEGYPERVGGVPGRDSCNNCYFSIAGRPCTHGCDGKNLIGWAPKRYVK